MLVILIDCTSCSVSLRLVILKGGMQLLRLRLEKLLVILLNSVWDLLTRQLFLGILLLLMLCSYILLLKHLLTLLLMHVLLLLAGAILLNLLIVMILQGGIVVCSIAVV